MGFYIRLYVLNSFVLFNKNSLLIFLMHTDIGFQHRSTLIQFYMFITLKYDVWDPCRVFKPL